MEIANELVKMQVDSGAYCSVLPRKVFPGDTEIKKTDLKVTTYSKTNLKVLDVAKVSLMKITLPFLALKQHKKWD